MVSWTFLNWHGWQCTPLCVCGGGGKHSSACRPLLIQTLAYVECTLEAHYITITVIHESRLQNFMTKILTGTQQHMTTVHGHILPYLIGFSYLNSVWTSTAGARISHWSLCYIQGLNSRLEYTRNVHSSLIFMAECATILSPTVLTLLKCVAAQREICIQSQTTRFLYTALLPRY